MRQKIYLTLLLLLAATTAAAHDFEVDGIFYKIINGNEAAVTYKGTIDEYNEYEEYFGSVTIPSTVTYDGTTYSVTAIIYNAFSYCSGLTSVTIPNSVTTIGAGAFSHCSGLTSVTVEDGNARFDSRNGCNAIIETVSNTLIIGCKNSTVPNSVTAIGDYAFQYCSGLTSVTIPNSVTSIGYSAFEDCDGLKNVTIPNSVTTIGGYAFSSCDGLTCVTIGNSITSISQNAFSFCIALTEVNIPNSVTSIGYMAFSCCSGLTSVTIPNSVTTIGSGAFSDCSGLTSVTIPNSVTTIGTSAFSGCHGLTSVTVEDGNTRYDSRNGCNAIIETESNTLIAGCKNSTIPNSVTAIGDYAFWDCSDLASVTIPSSVTSIGNNAFGYCRGLTSVTIPNSVTSIGDWAFGDCSGMTEVYSLIEDLSKVSIGYGAFYVYHPSGPLVYLGRKLHVPAGTLASYQADENWYSYFGTIVEMDPIVEVLGDVDGDGRLTVSDVTDLIDKILDGTATVENLPAADVNGDGNVNISDLTDLIDQVLSFNANNS